MISRVKELQIPADFLFIDDNSPDGTSEFLLQSKRENPWIRIIIRPRKMGVASAFLLGFSAGIEQEYSWIISMDGDLSHQLEDLVKILNYVCLESNKSLVIGSRYVVGGKVSGVSIIRRTLSKLGNLYARKAIGTSIRDTTGGFRAYKSLYLRSIPFEELSLAGYGFQLQILNYLLRNGWEVVEYPITFLNRRSGRSKITFSIVLEVFAIATKILISRVFDYSSKSYRKKK
jgi:dolichol-phosphate mannosyltransferase